MAETVVRNTYTIGEIFRRYGQRYEQSRDLHSVQRRVLKSIASCRTARLGGHKAVCGDCAHQDIAYNSCRDRHCPICQGINARKWVQSRKSELLPVSYFHLIFTIPSGLNIAAIQDSRKFYNLLFSAMSKALLHQFKIEHGAIPSVVSTLHTWGSNLSLHPHIHCIVSSGGLSVDGKRWIYGKEGYLVDVRKLSSRFKTVFLKGFARQFRNIELCERVTEQDWVVFAQKPFGDANAFLEYIGRYTHRSAISNSRIKSFDPVGGSVTFEYKDYRSSDEQGKAVLKLMTLPVFEFIRRFLQHALPERFRKIRFYGILGGRDKKEKIDLSRALIASDTDVAVNCEVGSVQEGPSCPQCGAMMRLTEVIPPKLTAKYIYFRNEKRVA